MQMSGDRHQRTSQQSSHRSHGHHNDRHGSDRRGGSDNHRSSNNNYSGSNNRNSSYGRDQRNRGHQSNRSANSGSQKSRGPSEGYSYPVCTTCRCRHPGDRHLLMNMILTPLYDKRRSGNGRDQRNMGQQSNRDANSGNSS
nr:hypothetical protein [Tanacetum cinerariifolium]